MRRASYRQYHFIYKTTCLTTRKYYIGMHSTDDMNDGYLGSGRRLKNSLRKYGTHNHVREIIEQLDTREKLSDRETEIVSEDLLRDELCMNISLGGYGGFQEHTSETKEKMRQAKLGKKQSSEFIALRSEGMKGHTVSESAREKIRQSVRLQWERRRAGDEFAIGVRKKS